MYFEPPLNGFPLEWVPALRVNKTRMMGLPGRQRSSDYIFSCLDRMHKRDRQTDGRTLGDSKDHAYAQ